MLQILTDYAKIMPEISQRIHKKCNYAINNSILYEKQLLYANITNKGTKLTQNL